MSSGSDQRQHPSRARTAVRLILGPLLAAIFGFAWFIQWAGWAVLDPTRVGWLLAGDDWSAHLFGWLFFRHEALAFPLGRIDGLLYPNGTTLGFTDSIPWVALLVRPFSGVLPEAFQYFGPWLALCCMLQGAIGARLSARFTQSIVLQALSGSLLAASPLLITRAGHPALVAQWIIVGLIALNVGPVKAARDTLFMVGGALLYSVAAAGIHPYLASMALPLALALVWRLALVDKSLRILVAVGASLVIVGAMLTTFWLLGYLGARSSPASGFGWFSSDLMSFLNPRGQSRFLPDLPSSRPHYEGWAFLGAGGLLVAACALLSAFRRPRRTIALPWVRALPLLVATVGLTVFALGPQVHSGAQPLFELPWVFEAMGWATAALRTNGRFIWAAHYVLLSASIVGVIVLWCDRPWISGVLLGASLVLQVVDFDWKGAGVFRRAKPATHLKAPEWGRLGDHYKHLALVPPQVRYAGAPCEGELPGHSWLTFGYLAYRQGMTINSGYAARYDLEAVHRACAGTNERVRSGELDPATVYVVGANTFAQVRDQPGVACGPIDGYVVCVNDSRPTPLLQALRR